jgi:hypothetical protein
VASPRIQQKRKRKKVTTPKHKKSLTMPPGRWMTPQRNHHQPSNKRRCRRSLVRLSPDPCAEGLNESTMRKQRTKFFSDAFKKEILVAGSDKSELSFRSEPLLVLVGSRSPPHLTEPFGLDCDDGRHAPAVPVTATPRGSRLNSAVTMGERAPALPAAAAPRGAVRTRPRGP